MKRIVLFFLLCLTWAGTREQTVFTYGKYAVSKDEFLKAYHKNNSSATGDSIQTVPEYLDLYIKFKLKVRAALDSRLDTLPSQKADLLNFRRSIESNFMKDDKHVMELAEEAYARSKKDIHVAHIFIPFDENIVKNPGAYQTVPRKTDTTLPWKKVQEAYERLKAGQDFDAVSTAYSLAPSDASVPKIGSDLGYITVFSLPYELENVIYSLPVGAYSKPFKSKAGYHIFKNLEERPAVGRIKIAQILLAYPPGSSTEDKKNIRKLGDSLYSALLKGAAFEELVKKYSDDRTSAPANGQLPEFGVGRYDAQFERTAFSLSKKGDLSKPFESAYGIHILKLIEHVRAPSEKKAALESFSSQVREDNRIEMAHRNFEKEIMAKVGFKQNPYDQKGLWMMTDSFLMANKVIELKTINKNTVLHSFTKGNLKVMDWLQYVKAVRTIGSPAYPEMMKRFVGISAMEYYQAHMEDYNPDFKYQINEFKEGNLLFEIMERQVWAKAAEDSVGLLKYYQTHRDKYKWGPSATAIFFTATNTQMADEAKKKLSAEGLVNWHKMVNNSNGRLLGDSGRFDLSQIPLPRETRPGAGLMTPYLINEQDSTVTFTYIVKVFEQPAPRSFEEARGLVINDYQNELEEKWIAQLKKKYPVVVNKPLVNSLSN